MSGVPNQMADNLASIFESGPTRAAPVRGRRARQDTEEYKSVPAPVSSPESSKSPDIDIVLSTTNLSTVKENRSDLPKVDRPSRRRQMWGATGQEDAIVEDSRFLDNIEKSSGSDEEDIPVIPELEELENDQPKADEIAAPPNAMFTEILSYRELDSDFLRQSVFQVLDNQVDLKLLTKAMDPESTLIEPDETWSVEKLFVEMQSSVKCCNKNIVGREASAPVDREASTSVGREVSASNSEESIGASNSREILI